MGERVILFHHGDPLAKFLEQENLPFLAGFNFYNGLAAATVAESLGVSREIIKAALQNPGTIPGRLEEINAGQAFTVIVDYAHSPVSLKALFEVLTPPSPPLTKGGTKRGSTIAVFGACGERDPKARPLMGSILDHGADTIIVTNDDPYG
jgi:UDP-N-acetylmuramoyl-L-alanyl-D-glutamate--2,6-diaminopimelate ligase